MSQTIASPHADSRPDPILVWDLPVRVFHWLMVASFAGAWITSEADGWRWLHVTLGYTMAALVGFRVVWGLVGTRYARFRDFVKGPSAAAGYLKSILSGHPKHVVGHNPAGGLAIVALLALTILATATGYANYAELGGEWLEEVHEFAANAMMAVVALHVLGVVVGSIVHRENLVRAMVTGRKRGAPSDGIASSRWIVAVALLAIVAGIWWYQGSVGVADAPRKDTHREKMHDDDD